MLSGSWEYQALLFGVAGALACLLLVGYRTRRVTPLCWLFLISLQHRNPLINHGEDALISSLLFFAIFLPWGHRFSLDALRTSPPGKSNRVLSMASTGYTVQVMLVYLFGALLKTSPEWRIDGTAIYYALSADGGVLPFGQWIRQFDALLTIGTWGTMVL